MKLLRLLVLAIGAPAVLAACSPAWLSPLERDHPLAGRILDTRTGTYLSRDAFMRRAIESRFVILGEAHDNPDHHRLQAETLESMLRAGRRPALAMEQFDREHQPALDAALARGERDPERIADAGNFDRKGWRWPDYRALVALATAYNLPILAANFSREDARTLMRSGRAAEGSGPAQGELRSALEQDIVDGHCGIRPPAAMLSGMVEAQRARDAQMARTMQAASAAGVVLVAGAGHARRGRGAPAYLSPAVREHTLVVAFVEVEAGRSEPAIGTDYDLVWFTPRAERKDPCADLRLPGSK